MMAMSSGLLAIPHQTRNVRTAPPVASLGSSEAGGCGVPGRRDISFAPRECSDTCINTYVLSNTTRAYCMYSRAVSQSVIEPGSRKTYAYMQIRAQQFVWALARNSAQQLRRIEGKEGCGKKSKQKQKRACVDNTPRGSLVVCTHIEYTPYLSVWVGMVIVLTCRLVTGWWGGGVRLRVQALRLCRARRYHPPRK